MKRFFQNSWSRWLGVFVALLICQGLLYQGHAWGFASSGLRLSLHPDADHTGLKFILGEESIKLILVLRHEASGPIATDRGFSQAELHHSLIVTDPGGQRHELAEEDAPHKMPQAFYRNNQLWLKAEMLPVGWVRSVTIEDLTELVPMMKTTPGWYTIEAQQPFIRFEQTGQDAGLGLLGWLDESHIWKGTVNSERMQIYIYPVLGAQPKLTILDGSAVPPTPLGQVPVKVFRVSDLPSGYDLSDVWEQFEPALTGTTNFDGWAVWDSGTPCVPEDNYTAVAFYSNEYKESLIASGEGIGWAANCNGLIERTISFGASPFPPLSRFSVFASNSVWVQSRAVVNSGNIGVLDESAGLWLDSGVEISIGSRARAEDGVQIYGDSVKIWQRGSVDDVFCNDLYNQGTVRGDITKGLELPLSLELPTFPDVDHGRKNITVNFRKVKDLAPGKYNNVTVAPRGTLRLKGGEYHFNSLYLGYQASLVCLASTEIRIKKRLYQGFWSLLGPDSGSGLTARDLVLYVEGTNGNLWDLLSYPKAVEVGIGSKIKANMYVPNGTLLIGANSDVTGSFIAKGVVVGTKSKVTLDSAF